MGERNCFEKKIFQQEDEIPAVGSTVYKVTAIHLHSTTTAVTTVTLQKVFKLSYHPQVVSTMVDSLRVIEKSL